MSFMELKYAQHTCGLGLCGLNILKKAGNPGLFIPYKAILADGGFLGFHMSQKIANRKKALIAEINDIVMVQEKFKEEIKNYARG